jgi:hypothetical protein
LDEQLSLLLSLVRSVLDAEVSPDEAIARARSPEISAALTDDVALQISRHAVWMCRESADSWRPAVVLHQLVDAGVAARIPGPEDDTPFELAWNWMEIVERSLEAVPDPTLLEDALARAQRVAAALEREDENVGRVRLRDAATSLDRRYGRMARNQANLDAFDVGNFEDTQFRGTSTDTPRPARRTRGARRMRKPPTQPPPMQQQGAPIDAEPDPTSVTRFPTIELTGEVKPRSQVEIVVDLALERDGSTETDGVTVKFPARKQKLPISVRLSCPELEFAEGADRGTIILHKTKPSKAWKTKARVSEGAGDSIIVRAIFSYEGRHCGSAKRAFGAAAPAPVEQQAPPAVPAPKKSPVPELPRLEAPRDRTAGLAEMDLDATPPTLTVEVTCVNAATGTYQWDLDMPRAVLRRARGLPRRLTCQMELGTNAAQFVTDLFAEIETLPETDHLAFFQGVGDDLYAQTPQCFKDTYWALVASEGASFPIQLLSDEPYVPWELMRPSRGVAGETSDFLGSNHPIGRWFLDHERALLPRLEKGNVATIAPDYSKRPELGTLPDARSESKEICTRLKDRATSLAGRKRPMLDLLEDGAKSDIALLHFAGHGASISTQTKFAYLYLEDEDLRVFEVRRNETMLGLNRHPLVLLNACQLAQSGLNLGVLGGFAEALMQREFGGLIAPLWAVYDDHAKDVSSEFVYEVVEGGRAFADVVRDIRKRYADRSPTFLSYLYYGDVMARFA